MHVGLGSQAGNPVTDSYWDNVGNVDYWHSHALISDETWTKMKKECNFSDPDCCSKSCDKLYNFATIHEVGQIDPYSIYTANCLVTIAGASSTRRRSHLNVRPNNPVLTPNAHMTLNSPSNYGVLAAKIIRCIRASSRSSTISKIADILGGYVHILPGDVASYNWDS